MKPIVILFPFFPPCIRAMVIFPLILVHPDSLTSLPHEQKHWDQQWLWFVRGFGIGLLVWWALYMFVLPFIWNPFRAKWEREAFKVDGLTDEQIRDRLRRLPYFLLVGV